MTAAVRRALAALLRRRHALTVIHPGESDSEGVDGDTIAMFRRWQREYDAAWDEVLKGREQRG